MVIGAVARCFWRELRRLEGLEPGLWRRFLLRKDVHHVPANLQPMPDGLSRRYVEIGRALNAEVAEERADSEMGLRSPLLAAAEAMLQDEVAVALLNEHDLLAIGAAP